MQDLVDFYMEVYISSPVGSGTEAAASDALNILCGYTEPATLADFLSEAHEAVSSSMARHDLASAQYYQEKIALLEQLQAQLAQLA